MPFIAIVHVTTPDQARAIRERYSSGDTGRVVGIYSFPSVDAMAPDNTCSGFCRAGGAWKRHPTNGHMIHVCGKRHREWRNRLKVILMDTFGINMMKRESTPRVFQNPEGYGR